MFLRPPVFVLLIVFLGIALLRVAACCGNDGGDENGRLRVVASTAIIADFVRQIVGDDVDLFTVIPGGDDVHGFAPSPKVARHVAEADVVLVNGYNLEEGVLDVILENRNADTDLVITSAGLTPIGGERPDANDDLVVAEGDPHLWLDVRNAMVYVENITDALVGADFGNAAQYRAREEDYLAELEKLDEEVRAVVAEIPSSRRTLIVLHDAFQYLATAYNLELAAAVLPASPTQQASAGNVATIIKLVKERTVPAIYGEPQFASEVLVTIAEETGARVLPLYSGTFTDDVSSYVELMRANAASLLDGLGE